MAGKQAPLRVLERTTQTRIQALVDDFLADRRAQGLSVRTVGWYEDTLRREFLPWCASEGITDPAQLTPSLVGRYSSGLLQRQGRNGRPLARETARSYVKAIRSLLAWCSQEGDAQVGASPRLPKAEHRLVEILSREEIQQMENAAKSERDKLIVRILADTGLRLGELLGLNVDDIHEPKRGEYAIKVRGKGARDRLVPLAPALHRRLRRYLSGRRAEGRDPLFVALRKGQDGRYARLTKSGLEQAVKVAALEAGIDRRVHPHLFRHSFATWWLQRGQNIVSLQRILGHADLTMIQGTYAHLSTSDDYAAAMKVLLGDG